MVEKIEVFIVECNECKEKYDSCGDGGYTVFEEESDAENAAIGEDWIVDEKETICLQCADERNSSKG